MLVLSRRVGEKIVIAELGISIDVIRLNGNSVRLGIEAPDSIRILRGELEGLQDCQQREELPVDSIANRDRLLIATDVRH